MILLLHNQFEQIDPSLVVIGFWLCIHFCVRILIMSLTLDC